MHPAARIFTIAVVIVLICSHLVLNLVTDTNLLMASRHLRHKSKSVKFGGVEGVNDPVGDIMDDVMTQNEETGGDDNGGEEKDGEEKGETGVEREAEVVNEPVSADDVVSVSEKNSDTGDGAGDGEAAQDTSEDS